LSPPGSILTFFVCAKQRLNCGKAVAILFILKRIGYNSVKEVREDEKINIP